MRTNCIYHNSGDEHNFVLSELQTIAPVFTTYGKRIHKPLTTSDMWFIHKNYKRRSVGGEINYRF
jgi:hypothetical protein